MNKMKRVFSLVLAFAIVLGTFGSVVPAFAETVDAPVATEELNVVPEDVIGTEYEAAVRRLVAFGLIEGYPDGTYKPEREINRAQMAKLLVYALGLDDAVRAAEGQSTGFSDVKGDYWAAGYINVASGQGLIKGYPDGTFRPAEKVTYAHTLTMLVRALGYQDEFLPGNWPGNYVAKAADVGITRGLRLPAQSTEGSKRGIVAQLINNTLDSKVVEIDRYVGVSGIEYSETNETLLKNKLEISKHEDTRIFADKIVDDSLNEDEVRVRFLQDTREEKEVRVEYEKDDEKVFDTKYNVRPLIGEEVTTYLTDRDVVLYVERENDDKANFDYVTASKREDEISLVKFDKDYKFDEDADVYLFDSNDNSFVYHEGDDLVEDDFTDMVSRMGKFVVRNNRVVYAEVLDPAEVNSEFLVVLKNDDGLVEGVSNGIEDFKIDLREDKDYDYTMVYSTKGEEMSLEDIEKGNLIYVQEQDYDGDDVAFVTVVQDNVVEGEVGNVKVDRIEIGGKTTRVVKSTEYHAYYTVDDYAEVKKWETDSSWEDDMEDAYEQDAIAYTDAVGRIAFLNVAGGDSGYKFGIVTRTYADKDRVRIYTTLDNEEGKDTIFKADKERDIKDLTPGQAVAFRLNADGEIADGKVKVANKVYTMADDFGKDVIKTNEGGSFVVTSDNVTVISAEGVQDEAVTDDNLDGYEYNNGRKVYIDDFDVATWKDIKEDKQDSNIEFFIFTKDNNDSEVDGLVFIGKDGANTGSDEVAVHILDKWRSGSDIKVEYVSYPGNEKQTRVIEEDDDSLVTSKVDKYGTYVGKERSNGKLSIIDESNVEDFDIYTELEIEEIDGNYIKLEGETEKLYISGALIYDEDNSKTSSYLKKGDIVNVIADGIRARIISVTEKGTGPVENDGTVTYINTTWTRFEVDGVVYTINEDTKLVDADGNTVAIGIDAMKSKLVKGDKVTVKDNVITRTFSVAAAQELAEAITAAEEAIAALPTVEDLTLDDEAAVEAARVLVDAVEELDEDAVVENIDVLEAAETKINQEKYFNYSSGNTFIKAELYTPSNPDRGLAAGFGLVFEEWTVDQLDSLKVTLLNNDEEVAIATLKDTSNHTNNLLSGAVYTIATETSSWVMDKTVSGELGETIYDSYVLEVVKDGVNYTFTYPVD